MRKEDAYAMTIFVGIVMCLWGFYVGQGVEHPQAQTEGCQTGKLAWQEGVGFQGSPMHYQWFVKTPDGREVFEEIDAPFKEDLPVVRLCHQSPDGKQSLCAWHELR